jgi:hypothetical protein
MFILDNTSVHSDHESGLITAILQPEESNNSEADNEDLILLSNIVDLKIPRSRKSIPFFSQKQIVYLIRYEEYPGFYRLGYVDDRPFHDRLKDHATATGLTPIVVLAFEQTSN